MNEPCPFCGWRDETIVNGSLYRLGTPCANCGAQAGTQAQELQRLRAHIQEAADNTLLERGMVHATEEAAAAHGRAMCGGEIMTSPAWKDAPDVAGLWMERSFGASRGVQINGASLKDYSDTGKRYYGPIPEDKK